LLAEPADRVVLPADAVQRTVDGAVVFVAEGLTRFHQRAVRATTLPDGRIAVDGLPGGLLVVVRGTYVLKSRLEAPGPRAE
jgi:hypothetical protein